MKFIVFLLCFFYSAGSNAQDPGFTAIDNRVAGIDAPTPDSLSRMLTAPYLTELAKARAIYSWIAQHIAYNTFVLKNVRKASQHFPLVPDDSTINWSAPDEITALKVMKRRIAVCEGYAKLFHVLCQKAGLQSKIIVGYARGYTEGRSSFRTNHTWNAVQVNGQWQLVDVTWGSGYVSYGGSFVQRLEERYFLADPELFAQDHLPEDPQWSLLTQLPELSEYRKTPFHYKSFVKYGLSIRGQAGGVVEAAVGDTVLLELAARDPVKDKTIAPDPFFDSGLLSDSRFVFLQPMEEKNRILYSYIVQNDGVEWINLLYNEDLVLRYRLKRRTDLVQ